MIVGERRGHRIGNMRHRITLKRPAEAVDASRQPIVTWTDQLTLQPAAYQQVSGGETFRGKQVEAGIVAVFTVNYRSEYTAQKQIVFRSQTYGIVRVDDPDGIRRWLDIYCKASPVG